MSKAHAMANEEHAQLLAVIQQLQKERQERISNLKNVVVDSARSQEDQQVRRHYKSSLLQFLLTGLKQNVAAYSMTKKTNLAHEN